MSLFNRERRQSNLSSMSDMQQRQYRLIFYTTFELIILSSVIMVVYALSNMWYLVTLICVGFILSLINLWVLQRTKKIIFCGTVSISIIILTIVIANYLIGGMGTPYSIWFYLIPLLAVSLLGWRSLVYFSIISLVMIVGFGAIDFQPLFKVLPTQVLVIEWANHLVAFVVLVTTLNSLMRENRQYEQILSDRNYLLQAEKDRFKHLSRFDQLTNLPNRQYFLQHLQEAIDSLDPKFNITVLFMDLDNFKYINDQFGHSSGDNVLRQTAIRLKTCFREGDFIARLGGDEFTALIIHAKDESIPNEIADRIRIEFKKPFQNIQYPITVSIGLSTFPNDATTVSELVTCADLAMYAAKRSSKLES